MCLSLWLARICFWSGLSHLQRQSSCVKKVSWQMKLHRSMKMKKNRRRRSNSSRRLEKKERKKESHIYQGRLPLSTSTRSHLSRVSSSITIVSGSLDIHLIRTRKAHDASSVRMHCCRPLDATTPAAAKDRRGHWYKYTAHHDLSQMHCARP